ncbi:MAG: PRC-barrel domain-containing protein [Niallia nealsonii]|uniref:PRC-barrel domain-containing protein n=1 Tax=Niallia circulans TaxID=1397 RepID=A0A941GF12_NIACI|nr:PRC-barrel domain-containing protein [Niallia circulans]MCB5235625.1 PRC-barrel domain-containing protein [Niallia circulans]MDU1844165.1 PRC-barrel domain-containing protein [Niallia nealsonii]
MKISTQLKGLPIISISNGQQEGNVQSLIINPEKGFVDFLALEQEEWQESIQAIPFKKVIGVGEYAVTIESANSIIDLTQIPIASELASKKINIIDTNVITRKGELVGNVTEYQINEETGEIIGLILKGQESVISSEYVITYGKDIIIVKEEAAEPISVHEEVVLTNDHIIEKLPKEELLAEDEASLNGLKEKQRELLLNKQVTKDIYSNDGELIVAGGSVLTLEDIEKAQNAGPSVVIDLSMSVNA